MVTDDEVLNEDAEVARERGDAIEESSQRAKSDHDVAKQLAFSRVSKAARERELLDFTDVVQHGARKSEVEIDLFIVRGGHTAERANREDVFEESATAGVMDCLSGRSDFVEPSYFGVAEDGFEKGFEMRILNSRNYAEQFGEHLVEISVGAGEVIGEIDLMIFQAAKPVNRKLRAVLKDLNETFDSDEVVAFEGIHHFGDVVPHLGFELAGAVGQLEGQVRITGLLLANVLR